MKEKKNVKSEVKTKKTSKMRNIILLIFSIVILSLLFWSFVDYDVFIPNRVELNNNLQGSAEYYSAFNNTVLISFKHNGVDDIRAYDARSFVKNDDNFCKAVDILNINTEEKGLDVKFTSGDFGLISFSCDKELEDDEFFRGHIEISTKNLRTNETIVSFGDLVLYPYYDEGY